MDQMVRIGGDRFRVVGKSPLSAVSRACYGKFRFDLRRVADGSAWTAFGTQVTPVSELLRGD